MVWTTKLLLFSPIALSYGPLLYSSPIALSSRWNSHIGHYVPNITAANKRFAAFLQLWIYRAIGEGGGWNSPVGHYAQELLGVPQVPLRPT